MDVPRSSSRVVAGNWTSRRGTAVWAVPMRMATSICTFPHASMRTLTQGEIDQGECVCA